MKATTKAQNTQLRWKTNDNKAQKNGPHGNIYWVRKQELNQDGSEKSSKWIGSDKYVGDWKNNKKQGFGIQYYQNGNKYEGGWAQNKRNGQGTLWVADGKNKLRREYTGDWEKDKKKGRGTMFFKNGDRYDGLWLDDKSHGEGRMIYANGDVYEGMWFMGKRSGYGVLTKRVGDHFQGHWVNDMREGQGSYFYSQKNQIFVGEWIQDTPTTGVYSEVQDPTTIKPERQKHFTDTYILPNFQPIGLQNPTGMLQQSIERVRKYRTSYRARFIPLDQLYTKQQLLELEKQFNSAVNESENISQHNLFALLLNMNFSIDEQGIRKNLKNLKPDYVEDQIDYELFVRLVAIILQQGLYQNKQNVENNKQTEQQKQQEQWFNKKQK